MHGSSQSCEQREIGDRIDRGPNRHEIANYFFEHGVNDKGCKLDRCRVCFLAI